METFKVGDVVRLKSGGPLMTVDTIRTEVMVAGIYCKWFITVKGNPELKEGCFQPDALMKEERVPRKVRDSVE